MYVRAFSRVSRVSMNLVSEICKEKKNELLKTKNGENE